MGNARIAEAHFAEGADFLQRWFAHQPDLLAELALIGLKKGPYALARQNQHGRNLLMMGDFEKFVDEIPDLRDKMQEILKMPESKTVAERDPALIPVLAQVIGEWPHFSSWPEGLDAIVAGWVARSTRLATGQNPGPGGIGLSMKMLVEARGRIPEIENDMSFDNFKSYTVWVRQSFQEHYTVGIAKHVSELVNMGRSKAQAAVEDAPSDGSTIDQHIQSIDDLWVGTQAMPASTNLRKAIRWLSEENKLINVGMDSKQRLDPWPEMEQHALESHDSRIHLIWAKLMYDGNRWEAGEPVIADDPKTAAMYEKITGVSLETKESLNMDDPKIIVKRAISLGQEFEDKEDIILQDLEAAIDYAQHIVGPWPELEKKLESNAKLQEKYRKDVLHGFYDEPESAPGPTP
jgi:hypothetical protein